MIFSSTATLVLFASLTAQIAAHAGHAHYQYGRATEGRSGMRLFPRQYTLDCAAWNDDQRALVNAEFGNAGKIAAYAQANLDSDNAKTFTSAFVPAALFGVVKDQLKEEYGHADTMISGAGYTFKVTCDEDHKFCKNGYYASMSDNQAVGIMNICKAFFEVKGTPAEAAGNLISTADIVAGCTGDSPLYKSLVDIRLGRAQMLLHEWTHTRFFTGTQEKTIDYAYGPKGCLNLAAGSRKMPANREYKDKKKTIPYCPDKNDPSVPGYCDPNLAIDNADTLAIMAAALWFSDAAQCNRILPIGETADPPPAAIKPKHKRQSASDEIVFDPPWNGCGFDQSSCSDPDDNGCCGDCQPCATPNTIQISSSVPTPSPIAEPSATQPVPPQVIPAEPTDTPAPLSLGAQQCNDESHFKDHGDIQKGFLSKYVAYACIGTALERISSSSNPFKPFHTKTNGVDYYLSISWVEGCKTTVESQSPAQPLPDKPDVTCLSLLMGDYTQCTGNGGVGGSIVAGCLRYHFSPSENGQT